MRAVTISFFLVICLIGSTYGQYSYQTDTYSYHRGVDGGVLIAIWAAAILIPIISMTLCCLCCPASPVSRCCCPNRKDIRYAGVIIQGPPAASGFNYV